MKLASDVFLGGCAKQQHMVLLGTQQRCDWRRACTSGKHFSSAAGLAVVMLVLLSCASGGGAFVTMGSTFFTRCVLVRQVRVNSRGFSSWRGQGMPGPSLSAGSVSPLYAGEGEDGRTPEMEVSPPGSSPEAASPLDRDSRRQPLLSRKKLLDSGARAIAATLGVGVGSGGGSRTACLLAGVPVAAGGWGVGLGQGVQSAEAFGGPSRPLNRCLVIAVNAREFCRRLEADLAAGRNAQECRGMVKSVLRGLSLPESLKDAVLYLPGGKRQAATDAGQSAVEYLATVVEFDAWDKLDKDWTSNVALRNMTPDNIMFVRMALDASGSSLDVFLRQFNQADVDSAREVYREYFLPVEEQEPRP